MSPQGPWQYDFLKHFPFEQYPEPTTTQRRNLEILSERGISTTFEDPTGSGKTAVAYTFAKTMAAHRHAPVLMVTPTKTQVDQIKQLHPEVTIVYGRNEYPCFYYEEEFRADEVPCSMLKDCPHRVNQTTGQTKEPRVEPCPYLLQKFQAKQSDIVACSTAFYLFTQLFHQEWGELTGLVIDEAHQLAKVVRNCLSYEITDYHLGRCVELLRGIGATQEAEQLARFLRKMIQISKGKPAYESTLLKPREIAELVELIKRINRQKLEEKVQLAVEKRQIDPEEQREVLKQMEIIINDLHHYFRSLELSLETKDRHPLNYVFAYYKKELAEREKVRYRLFIKCYYVIPIIKQLLAPFTVTMSATIGDPRVFSFETGIRAKCYSFPSEFPADHTRVFMPKDTPDLAMKSRGKDQPRNVLRRIATACRRFADAELRSLVVVISNQEREKFLELASAEGLAVISYGNGVTAKEAALKFKNGEGQALVGTVANFGEGIDLPKQLAPVIFFLRPGYPRPKDPAAQFEEQRFGGRRWALWNWRVMIEALQVRGRNIRGPEDLGVTFFISQQFRRFIAATLPEWLRPAYRGDWNFAHCVREAEELLGQKVLT